MKESNTGVASINVDVGKSSGWVASWLASLATAFLAGAILVGVGWYADTAQRTRDEIAELRQRDRAHDAYIQAAYRGQNKPEVK